MDKHMVWAQCFINTFPGFIFIFILYAQIYIHIYAGVDGQHTDRRTDTSAHA